MNNLCAEQYQRTNIPGYSAVPRALFWLRKAAADGIADAAKEVAQLESQMQGHCANCNKKSDCFPEQLKHCAKCKSVWYCGRKCQLEHWKDGHKIDCVKS